MAEDERVRRFENLQGNLRRAGIQKEDVSGTYAKWGVTYEQDLLYMGYGAYRPPAQTLSELYAEDTRDNVRILDVAAGTGLLGIELKRHGFTNIDALDPSEEMMAEAKRRGVYKKYIIDYITEKPSNILQDTYDVVVGSGLIGYTHVPYTAIHEMIRLTKRGGHVVLSTREDVPTMEEHKGMEPLMERLEAEGKWIRLSKTIYPGYFNNINGALYVFRVL